MRVPRSQPMMIESSTPGTPTHSNTTQPDEPAAAIMFFAGSIEPAARSRQAWYGETAAGSITTSAPIASASSRRDGTKSAATIGPTPKRFSVAITASAMAPQPITSGISLAPT